MTATEYLAGFISILVGLSVAEIAQSTHRLLRSRARVRWHWYPFAAAVLLLLLTVELWWNTETMVVPGRAVTIGAFLPVVLGLILLYLTCAAVLPDEVPAQGLDLRTDYLANARWFWTLFALTMAEFVLLRLGRGYAYFGWPKVQQLLPLILIALFVSLAFVRRSWWHTLLLLLLPLVFFTSMINRPLPVSQAPTPAQVTAGTP